MSIERLSGGLSPADGADPRTFPEIFNGFADEFEGKNIPAFGTAVPSDGDALVYNDAEGVYEPGEGGAGSLEDLTDTSISSPVSREVLSYDGTDWVNDALTSAQLPAGSVLQVVQVVKNNIFSTTTPTNVTGLAASITPSSASSQILVNVNLIADYDDGGAPQRSAGFTVFRGATNLCSPASSGSLQDSFANIGQIRSQSSYRSLVMNFLDSPATTSPTTYQVAVANSSSSATIYVNRGRAVDLYRGVSTITLMEVAG